MTAQTKKRPAKGRTIQHPTPQRQTIRSRFLLSVAAAGLVLLAAVAGLVLLQGRSDGPAGASEGLPATSDYHSLLVSPDDPQRLLLGTHQGLYSSSDGGRTWTFAQLQGQDAMNLARPTSSTIWAAGHEVLAKSTDGGATWSDVRPDGLPGLDVHGFAADPQSPRLLYAAIAGKGLYRSGDGGQSFSVVSTDVGPDVMALAVTPDDRILAGDMRQGLLESRDGGRTWTLRLRAALMGIAVNPSDPKRVLATGPGIALSRDGGRTWKPVLDVPDGAGPVAWAPSAASVAYAVGFDRTLYRTADGGTTWSEVAAGKVG